MAYQDVIEAAAPLRYWPMDEASGTTAAEVMAGDDGTAVGMTMGGGLITGWFASVDGPGLNLPAANFTGGSEHIVLHSGALLGGLNEFTVEALVKFTPVSSNDGVLRAFYGEAGSSGNDFIRACAMASGGASSLRMTYGSDAGVLTNASSSLFITGVWTMMHMIRNGNIMRLYWDGGQRQGFSNVGVSNTWTNAGLAAWAGNSPRGDTPWRGQMGQLAVYDRELTPTEMRAHHQAAFPLTRTPPSKVFFKANTAVWNQRLDNPSSPPTIAANSAVLVSNLVAQCGLSAPALNDGRGPFYTVDNSTPTQRVRIWGGADSNPSTDKPALWNALQQVPIPTPFHPGVSTTDKEVQIYNEDTDELWEFWVMEQTLARVGFATKGIAGTAGVLPAGVYRYLIGASDGTGIGTVQEAIGSGTVDGTQAVRLNWGLSEAATSYRIYRSNVNASFTTCKLIATVAAPGLAFTDDGSVTVGTTLYSAEPVAVTTDWTCSYGGYQAGTDNWVGHWTAPRANWGATATSLPMWGGAISLNEAMARHIPHALTMALLQSTNTHVYPAQRHDFWGGTYAIPEGTRFQLDPAFDINLFTNPFAKAVAEAYQIYGGYISDHAGGITLAYIEDQWASGRNWMPSIYDGKLSFEVLSEFLSLNAVASMRVVDPAWTLAQAGTLPSPPGPGPYWGMRL